VILSCAVHSHAPCQSGCKAEPHSTVQDESGRWQVGGLWGGGFSIGGLAPVLMVLANWATCAPAMSDACACGRGRRSSDGHFTARTEGARCCSQPQRATPRRPAASGSSRGPRGGLRSGAARVSAAAFRSPRRPLRALTPAASSESPRAQPAGSASLSSRYSVNHDPSTPPQKCSAGGGRGGEARPRVRKLTGNIKLLDHLFVHAHIVRHLPQARQRRLAVAAEELRRIEHGSRLALGGQESRG